MTHVGRHSHGGFLSFLFSFIINVKRVFLASNSVIIP